MANFALTNRGMRILVEIALRATSMGGAVPAGWKCILITVAAVPTADTNVLSQLTQVANGNGYVTGGVTVERSAVGWPDVVEDDATDTVSFKAKDVSWTAAGGNIPAAGAGPHYAVIVDDAGDPNVIAYYNLGSAQTILDGAQFKLEDLEIQALQAV